MQLTSPVGTLDTTVKVKYQLSARPDLTMVDHIHTLLSPFGAIESSDIVISLKPAPPKKPKRGTALVPFKQIGDAFGAVCANGRADRGLAGVEITWAEDKEPELIGWLKKMGKLGTTQPISRQDSDIIMRSQSQPQSQTEPTPQETPSAPASNGAFSSFPSSFPSSFVSAVFLRRLPSTHMLVYYSPIFRRRQRSVARLQASTTNQSRSCA